MEGKDVYILNARRQGKTILNKLKILKEEKRNAKNKRRKNSTSIFCKLI